MYNICLTFWIQSIWIFTAQYNVCGTTFSTNIYFWFFKQFHQGFDNLCTNLKIWNSKWNSHPCIVVSFLCGRQQNIFYDFDSKIGSKIENSYFNDKQIVWKFISNREFCPPKQKLQVAIGVIPFGTGNDYSRVTGWGPDAPKYLIGSNTNYLKNLQIWNFCLKIELRFWLQNHILNAKIIVKSCSKRKICRHKVKSKPCFVRIFVSGSARPPSPSISGKWPLRPRTTVTSCLSMTVKSALLRKEIARSTTSPRLLTAPGAWSKKILKKIQIIQNQLEILSTFVSNHNISSKLFFDQNLDFESGQAHVQLFLLRLAGARRTWLRKEPH